ncbi:MAG: hypothetical protein COT73_05265 [Bdellovibrio sp. CG10_big_fil_rev_8_21_14_0_10_47_8]|nr:MAG: hypothetical protein COT73_05265 [Bdellovibrio sp. CG10_big_fil_rev_8_21_14_0_10_47_8]
MFVLCLLLTLPSLAAPSKVKSQTKNLTAREILSLPESQRLNVAEKGKDQVYGELIELSKSAKESMVTRWKALTLAAKVKKHQAIPDLKEALQAPEWFLRNAALLSLQEISPLKARPAAEKLLQDRALVVRSAAVDVLAEQMDNDVRQFFWSEFQEKRNFRLKTGLWIRAQILSRLSQAPQKQEANHFIEALKEKDQTLYPSAIVALEKISRKKMGMSSTPLSQKRNLWIKWAQNSQNSTVN